MVEIANGSESTGATVGVVADEFGDGWIVGVGAAAVVDERCGMME